MKLYNILLASLLVVQFVSAHYIKKPNHGAKAEKIFNYNFHCLKDNRRMCSKLQKKVKEATDSFSTILEGTPKVNFEVFVDNLSKYRVDKSKEVLALALDTEFNRLNPNNTNIISPYPNSKVIQRKLKNKKNVDFILLLNSFKNDKKYLNDLQDERTLILLEIYEGIYSLGSDLPYPYNEKKVDKPEELITGLEMARALLEFRKNETFIEEIAIGNENKYETYSSANKLYDVVRWEDTLISKGFKNFPKLKYKYKRTVVIGDIHGDFKKLRNVLRHAKLIDKNDDWIATDTILVQLGDLTDRGPDFKQNLDILIKLREQARERGGIVYIMLGNHELYDMQAGYFVLSKSDFDNFGGVAEREKALSMEGEYGELLRNDMNITLVVDETLFVHAGLTYKYAKLGLNELNKRAHEILSTAPPYDVIYDEFISKNITHPLYMDPIFDMTEGPLWNRYYNEAPEEESCKELEKVLKVAKAKRMIIGHTIQEYGHINTKCNNKLIFVDIALSRCLGNYFGYVEILNDKREIWARYNN